MTGAAHVSGVALVDCRYMDPTPAATSPTEVAPKRSRGWKWVVVGLALTTAFTLLGRLPPTPMSDHDFGLVIGRCMSGGVYAAVLWAIVRLVRRKKAS